MALLRAADDCVKATEPPKGPAAAPLRTRATHTLLAGHAGRHLDLHVELCAGGERDTLDAEAGDILGDFGALEGGLGGPARGTIDISGEGACAVLVDLGTC
jgi:hypothetical protein